jgi:predicted alpha/beta superfamily hydrolase
MNENFDEDEYDESDEEEEEEESEDEDDEDESEEDMPSAGLPYYEFNFIENPEYEEDDEDDEEYEEDVEDLEGTIYRHHFYSKTLSNRRLIDVYVPPNYHYEQYKSYPVLYMHDGNNLFDPSMSFGGVTWEVDTTVEDLIKNNLMEEIIVVGISNTYNRDYEYTWTSMYLDFDDMKQGGGGRKYSRFIVSELKPFIDKRYRTLPFRETTAVMGSSLGGLISFYLGLYYPHVFSKIGMMSPSLWWGNGIIFKHVKDIIPNMKIWLDMGTKEYDEDDPEDDPEENIRNTRLLRSNLLNLGYVDNENLGYFEHSNAEHNEFFWAERLHLPLLFFFGK